MVVELDAYHDALIALFKSHFGDSLATVEAYLPSSQSDNPELGLTIKTPALLIEIEATSQGKNYGDDLTAVQCGLAIHCILGVGTENLQRELRNFGVEVQRLLTKQNYCLGSELKATNPEDVNGMPGLWQKNGVGGYDSWVVTFNQTVYLGESVWELSALAPDGVEVTLLPHFFRDPLPELQ